mgnify:CR=1 FL=1
MTIHKKKSVQTLTFGSEFLALKAGVENIIKLRYHLGSMGVHVTQETQIYVDNNSVNINATNPTSMFNKKHIALCYHFVREHNANDVIGINKIDSKDNCFDPFTKGKNSKAHGKFLS